MRQFERSWLSNRLGDDVIQHICQTGETLEILNLSCYGKPVEIRCIIESCIKLTELNLDVEFVDYLLSQESLSFLCNNLTPTIRKLSLFNQPITDEHVQALVTRCDKITELNICCGKGHRGKPNVLYTRSETNEITNKAIIVKKLSNTLVKLGIDYVTDVMLKHLQSMAKLRHLAVRYVPPVGKGRMEGESFQQWKEQKKIQYPNINIIRCVEVSPFRIGFFQEWSSKLDGLDVDPDIDTDSDVDPDADTD